MSHLHLMFELLEGAENYESWSMAMKAKFKTVKLWNIVNDENLNLNIAANRDKNDRAIGELVLAVQKHIYPLISDCETAFEAWNLLKERFEDSNNELAVSLRCDLYNLRYEECKDMADMMEKITNTSRKLTKIGSAMDDRELLLLAESKVPPKYRHVISSLRAQNLLTFNRMKNRLIQEEKIFKRYDSATSASRQDVLFKVKVDNDPVNIKNGSEKSDIKNFICHRCGKPGHTSRYCRNEISNENNLKKNFVCFNCGKPGHMAKFCLSKTNYNVDALCVRKPENICNMRENTRFILDSGASSHMTCNKSLYSSVQETNVTVSVADDRKISCNAVGEIRMDLDVRGESRKVLLQNVLYAENLKVNILSVSKLRDRKSVV